VLDKHSVPCVRMAGLWDWVKAHSHILAQQGEGGRSLVPKKVLLDKEKASVRAFHVIQQAQMKLGVVHVTDEISVISYPGGQYGMSVPNQLAQSTQGN
jgi:hypothetical protein